MGSEALCDFMCEVWQHPATICTVLKCRYRDYPQNLLRLTSSTIHLNGLLWHRADYLTSKDVSDLLNVCLFI